jgi:hypothetical protein
MYVSYAPEAMGMAPAVEPRVRVNGSCISGAFWSPMFLGTTDQKHRLPRRAKASP